MRAVVSGTPEKRNPGESIFLHDASGRTALVDLGTTASAVGLVGGLASPDIVVLSHDDEDHVNGWPGFEYALRHGPRDSMVRQVSGALNPRFAEGPELWLPSDWYHVVVARLGWLTNGQYLPPGNDGDIDPPSLLTDTELSGAVAGARLTTGLRFVPEDPPPGAGRSDIALSGGPDPTHPTDEDDSARDIWSRLVGALSAVSVNQLDVDQLEDAIGEIRGSLGPGVMGRCHVGWNSTNGSLARRALQRSEAISQIIMSAYNLNCRIRLFSPDGDLDRSPYPWQREGEPGFLTVVNAREVEPLPLHAPPGPTCVALLSLLTIQNRRALVTLGFVGPDDSLPVQASQDEAAGLLIWSDSDGSGIELDVNSRHIPWTRIGAMTSPHHGSKAAEHERVWAEAAPSFEHLTLLNVNNALPTTQAFLNHPPTRRGCTRCSRIGAEKEWWYLSAEFVNGGWTLNWDCQSRC